MRVCVCGWHFEDEFYRQLYRINTRHPVHVIANREHPLLAKMDLPYTLRENIGLEWGAYNHYLQHVWPHDDAVLFCHDDIVLEPIMHNYQIVDSEIVIDSIANGLKVQPGVAYVFTNRAQDVENNGRHGRMIYAGVPFLEYVLNVDREIWYDKNNCGWVGPGTRPDGVEHYNAGVERFDAQALRFNKRAAVDSVYVASIAMGKRGEYVKNGGVEYGNSYKKTYNFL